MIIRTVAYPRAALVGNPSDGYNGRTIAFTFDAFQADVVCYETPNLELLPTRRDGSVFSSLEGLVEDVKHYGYYGGIRLIKAAIKEFYDYCRENGIELHRRNFTMQYKSTIPNLVGMSGSSAIITACFRALMTFYGVSIPPAKLANAVLSAERTELGIAAGLQDRVVQAFEGLVYMDFDKKYLGTRGYGDYEHLDERKLPPTYIAYCTEFSEESGIFHNDLRSRYNHGDKDVVDAMRFWADLTDSFRAALEAGDVTEMNRMINANFDKRASLCRLAPGLLRMVEVARACGASAKFTGSGGAIVGFYQDEAMFEKLSTELAKMKVQTIRPTIIKVH